MENAWSAGDRVRANTAREVNTSIDDETGERLRQLAGAGPEAIEKRLQELQNEWDIERVLQAEAAATGILSLVLGLTVNRRWWMLTGLASGMLLLHGVQGWYPMLPLFRRMGFRTRREIAVERYALKAMRGDFSAVRHEAAQESGTQVDRALELAGV